MKLHAKRLILALVACITLFCFAQGALAIELLPEKAVSENSSTQEIKQLQDVLVALLLLDKADATGEYNQDTAAAVGRLQALLGLEPSGQFDKNTVRAYNEYVRKMEEPKPLPLKGYKIGIDAGHQKKADNKLEPIAPDSPRTKERMTPGCVGVKTGTNEYEITLIVANKLKKQLESAGAEVVMTRTKNDVSLSNIDRAKKMNKEDVDFWVRIHCDSSSDRAANGAHIIVPAKSSAPGIYVESLELGKKLLTAFCLATEAKQNAVLVKNDQTGMNWSDAPVATLEMGYLSNPNEDTLLNRDSYQNACAKGAYNGILSYCQALENSENPPEKEVARMKEEAR